MYINYNLFTTYNVVVLKALDSGFSLVKNVAVSHQSHKLSVNARVEASAYKFDGIHVFLAWVSNRNK